MACDATKRLVQGTNEDGEVSLYTYNGLGVRVGRELIVKDNTHGYTDFHKETPSVGSSDRDLRQASTQTTSKFP